MPGQKRYIIVNQHGRVFTGKEEKIGTIKYADFGKSGAYQYRSKYNAKKSMQRLCEQCGNVIDARFKPSDKYYHCIHIEEVES